MSRKVDILARQRSATAAAIRWTISQDLFLPDSGFTVERSIDGATTTVVRALRLPGALELASGDWDIDEDQLGKDHADRSVAPGTPTLPMIAYLLELRPILLYALPRATKGRLEAELINVAAMLGDSHAQDLGLKLEHWPTSDAPSRQFLPALRNGSANDQLAYRDVVLHYRQQATIRLLLLASDYPMSILLGLGFEDELPDQKGDTQYELLCNWVEHKGSARTRLDVKDASWPAPPTLDAIRQGDAWCGYPAFARFFSVGAKWAPGAAAGDVVSERLIANALKGPRTVRTASAQLAWQPGKNDNTNGDEPPPLLGRGEVAWRIERHTMGVAPTAGGAAPDLDPAGTYISCHDGDPLLRSNANWFEDDVDLPWGDTALEGWYAYRISAIDTFGISGPPSDSKLACLRDRYAPSPPRPRLAGQGDSLTLQGNVNTATLALDWEAANELASPDAAEFRVCQTWTSVEYLPLEVRRSIEIGKPLSEIQVDVKVMGANGEPVASALLKSVLGGKLLTPDGEFEILAESGLSTLRVRRSAGREPPRGGAMARYAVTHSRNVSIGRLARDTAVVGAARVVEIAPLTIELLDPMNAPQPARDASLYLHLLGVSLSGRGVGTHFVIEQPDDEAPQARELYDHVVNMSAADASALLDGSPVIALPPHCIDVELSPPASFASGTVRFTVTAADDTSYVATSSGPGNEGSGADLVVVARRPEAPTLHPRRVPRLWARDASEFVEYATANVTWTPMEGAIRYEVERALESALAVTPAASDDALVAAAEHAPVGTFERVTNAAFLPCWSDQLPGRAPARVVYRVRGVSAANTQSDWQIAALVRVPDVRIAPPCNLLTARPPIGQDRKIALCWTQPGPAEGIGFVIEARNIPGTNLDGNWERVADLLPGSIMPGSQKRFTANLPNCRPGAWREYRVKAVRHVLDPADPRAKSLRRVDGRPSNILRARATGELRSPEDFVADISKSGVVTLRWHSPDKYNYMEIRRRAPGGLGLSRRPLGGDAELFRETDPLPSPGEWTYELAAIADGRRAVTKPLIVEWLQP